MKTNDAAETSPVTIALPATVTIGTITCKVEAHRNGLTLVGPRGGRMEGVRNVHHGYYTVLKSASVFVRLRHDGATGELVRLG